MLTAISALAERAAAALIERNALYERFFAGEANRLAQACREMSERFLHGGRLVAFGRGPYSTDAQHVSVEFVHPVIVGTPRPGTVRLTNKPRGLVLFRGRHRRSVPAPGDG